MRAVVVRYQTSAETADDNQKAVEAVFAELAESQPEGVHYMTLRMPDSVTFVHVAVFDGTDNPLARTPAFQAFQDGLPARQAQPHPEEGTIVGRYGI